MIVSIATFGRSLRDCPPTSVSSKATEILWALIPIAIVLAAAAPALSTIVFVGDGAAAAHSGSPRKASNVTAQAADVSAETSRYTLNIK
jgi:heme/copper-type cytochrome/quinol oxidase subunit 2